MLASLYLLVATGRAHNTAMGASYAEAVGPGEERFVYGLLSDGALFPIGILVIALLAGLPWIIVSPALTLTGWTALGLLGVVQLGVSYWLFARALKHVTALESLLIPVIEPILNPVWVLIALQEKPSPLALVGGGIVLSAVTVRAVISVRNRRPAPGAAPA